MQLTIPYNKKGKERKRLAEDIGNALGTIPKYLGVPSMCYQMGDCLLDKNGTLTIPDIVEKETAEMLLSYLEEHGYKGEVQETADRLTIDLPRTVLTDAQLDLLRQMIAGREPLLKRAFCTERLEVQVTDEQIAFPWFTFTQDADEVRAYTEFVVKLCEQAARQKRVMLSGKDTDNDKYTMRCLLLRLGFIGDEYKAARKILLRNLSGNSAFRYGEPPRA